MGSVGATVLEGKGLMLKGRRGSQGKGRGLWAVAVTSERSSWFHSRNMYENISLEHSELGDWHINGTSVHTIEIKCGHMLRSHHHVGL